MSIPSEPVPYNHIFHRNNCVLPFLQILQQRARRKLKLDETKELPDFSSQASEVRHGDWKVCPIPKRLQCRHVDLGDVSPSNTQHFVAALKSTAQGIQVSVTNASNRGSI